ncbi:hypothetical protein FNN84_22840 [Salmonella enterica subsp. salamae]|uniref:Uncharacterized protein n=1 Tax=Salmonella enterica subsp. salamae TaxID=59202 RepID=A0A5Y2S773_SALER|nr:hypothetical protein [Salmonella enterica subsp. salamae]ECF6053995.1 hypothetical protein [Salmonella enterica subsp. salamae]ECG1232653.1 hypothetical protein [Salmonella enterica subsp. salamae]ECI3324156.1 hypothetical protein [Salmonella enterica subsp. salamae]ECJ2314573.1 hypothetical protein [Salmonella enterica subsp. salamae]
MNVNESVKTRISLPAIRAALLALGHEKLWLRDSAPFIQIITWDEFVVAELNRSGQGWEIFPAVNLIYSNPEDVAPDDAQELTEECVARLSVAYP